MAKRRMDMNVAENLVLSTAQAHLDAIGMYIAYKRGARSQDTIALRSEVSAATVSNFENCESLIREPNALAILEAVGAEAPEQLYAAYKSAWQIVEAFSANVQAA